VGATQNLSKTLDAKIDAPEIERYYDRVCVCVTWSLVKPEYYGGIIRYLAGTMKPEIDNPDAECYADEALFAVFLPG